MKHCRTVEWKVINEHVRGNIEKYGQHYSHIFFRCFYEGNFFCSATLYPKTAIRLLTSKIYNYKYLKHSHE